MSFILGFIPKLSFGKVNGHAALKTIKLWSNDWQVFEYQTLDDIKAELEERFITVAATASLGNGLQIGNGSVISHHAYVGSNVQIGNNVIVCEKAVIADNTAIGNSCVIRAHANVQTSEIGSYVVIGSGATIGEKATIMNNHLLPQNARIAGGTTIKESIYVSSVRDEIGWFDTENLHVGCKAYSLQEWVERYTEIGSENKYTASEIELYGIFINLISSLRS